MREIGGFGDRVIVVIIISVACLSLDYRVFYRFASSVPLFFPVVDLRRAPPLRFPHLPDRFPLVPFLRLFLATLSGGCIMSSAWHGWVRDKVTMRCMYVSLLAGEGGGVFAIFVIRDDVTIYC
jgi:hypothetical protein